MATSLPEKSLIYKLNAEADLESVFEIDSTRISEGKQVILLFIVSLKSIEVYICRYVSTIFLC